MFLWMADLCLVPFCKYLRAIPFLGFPLLTIQSPFFCIDRDFAVFVATCHGPLAEISAQPTLYLPKMEGRYETEWWSKIFDAYASMLGISPKVIRSTTMIEVGR